MSALAKAMTRRAAEGHGLTVKIEAKRFQDGPVWMVYETDRFGATTPTATCGLGYGPGTEAENRQAALEFAERRRAQIAGTPSERGTR